MGKINKKGQVAIFVMAGLVILLIAIISLYATSRNRETAYEKEVLKENPSYAGQTELSNYVDACIRPAVLQGMEIIRLQGGYINILSDVKTMIVKDKGGLQVKDFDGSKKVVVDLNGEGNEVPYWITKDSLSVPSLSFMEAELEEYAAKEVKKCVNDFQPFREQNYNVSYEDIDVTVDMEKAVVVNIKFPITMQKGDIRFDEEDFAYTVPVNMQLIDEMAADLTIYESAYTYLEDTTYNLISLYSNIDEERLPPFGQSSINMDCDYVTWEKRDVKKMLKSVFNVNFPHLKIQGTSFSLPSSKNDASKKIYESFVHELFEKNHSNIEINFSYRPDWEFNDFDIKPSRGETLAPHTVRDNKIPFIGLVCVFDYSFKYTIDAPVFVEIKDTESALIDPVADVFFDKRGFKFQFLMDAYLCGNQKRECTGKPKFFLNSTNLPNNPNSTILPESHFCNPEQRISGDITINTYDSMTNNKLADVDVFYYCGSYQNDCYIGRTDDNGQLTTKFPYCINGMIYFLKKDYAEHKKELTVFDTANRNLNYYVGQVKNFDVEVKKIHVPTYVRNYHEAGSLDIGSSLMNLEPNDKAMLTANGPTSFSYVAPDPDSRQVKVSEGSYDLSISFIGDVELKKSPRFDQEYTGSYMLGSTSIPWKVEKEDLSKNKVTFYTLAEHSSSELNPGTWDDLGDLILTDEGMSAELLYKCEAVDTNPVSCNYNNCDFAGIDGTSIIDFNDNPNNCEKAYQVLIKKEQYQDYVQPRFV